MGEDHAIAQLNEILSRPDFQSNVGRPVWDQLFGPMLAVLFAPGDKEVVSASRT